MIFDDFKNIRRFSFIPHLKEIEDFVASRDCSKIPDGQHDILGQDLFVRVAEYKTGHAEEKQFEAHTVYADLQLVISGSEIMQVAFEKSPNPVTSYNPEADIQFFENPQDFSSVLVSAGQFTVFFPGELHKPGCLVHSSSESVKKLVFKINMSTAAAPVLKYDTISS